MHRDKIYRCTARRFRGNPIRAKQSEPEGRLTARLRMSLAGPSWLGVEASLEASTGFLLNNPLTSAFVLVGGSRSVVLVW